jgi:integrase
MERRPNYRSQGAAQTQYVWAIRQQLKSTGRVRDLALFNCALDAKLRASDVVRLRVSDVAPGGALRSRSTVIQQKTGRPVPFEITDPTRDALVAWLARRGRRPDDWLFPSRSRAGAHITTRQYARLVDSWVRMIDLDAAAFGTHSLRRSKVALVYKKTAISELATFSSVTGSLRAPSDISVPRWMTPSNCQSRSNFDSMAGPPPADPPNVR